MNKPKSNECLMVDGPRKGQVLSQVYTGENGRFDFFTRDGGVKITDHIPNGLLGKNHLRDGHTFRIISHGDLEGIDINSELDRLTEPLKPLNNIDV